VSSAVEQDYDVVLEGERHYVVSTDQRDWVQMEVRGFPDGALLTKARYLVFNAMKRQKLIQMGWERFNGEECVSVSAVQENPKPAGSEGEESDPLS
jgi:hypothetical protein